MSAENSHSGADLWAYREVSRALQRSYPPIYIKQLLDQLAGHAFPKQRTPSKSQASHHCGSLVSFLPRSQDQPLTDYDVLAPVELSQIWVQTHTPNTGTTAAA
jgi:hypothetical protein